MENSDQVLLKAHISMSVPRCRAKEANKYGREWNCSKATLVTGQACPCETMPRDKQSDMQTKFYHKNRMRCVNNRSDTPPCMKLSNVKNGWKSYALLQQNCTTKKYHPKKSVYCWRTSVGQEAERRQHCESLHLYWGYTLTKTLTKSSMNFFFILKSSSSVSQPAHLVVGRWHIFCVLCISMRHKDTAVVRGV